MDRVLELKLAAFRDDYLRVTGKSFESFFCPLLLRDENVPICKAHVINQAFSRSPKNWTVQREDIDGFYGTHFEADFISVQHSGRLAPYECLVHKRAAVELRPEIRVRGEKAAHYPASGPTPPGHTRLVVETDIGSVQLGLKMCVAEVGSYAAEDWQVLVEKDVRLPALVSLIKSAYLTLFELLGYRYALSSSGLFVGRTILGCFFDSNRNEQRGTIRQAAKRHFAEFKNLVRPATKSGIFESTIADRKLLVCETRAELPAFLKSGESKLHTRFCIVGKAVFSKSSEASTMTWPEVDLT